MPNTITSGGRPTVITSEVLTELKAVLQRGISIKKACEHVGIGEKTFYRHYSNDSSFQTLVDTARNFATLIAGEVVVNDIVKNKNVNTAKWWLERKDPDEFSNRPVFQQLNQFNKYEFISDAEFSKIASNAGIPKLDPLLIAKALKQTKG